MRRVGCFALVAFLVPAVALVAPAFPDPPSVGGGPPSFPSATLCIPIEVEVETFAYVSSEHLAVEIERPGICQATRNRDALNEVVIKGLSPGESNVAIRVEEHLWMIVHVIVTPRQEWPPRWTEENRMSAAAQLLAEADVVYAQKSEALESWLPAYYRYRKVSRLYDNCKSPPPAPHARAQERASELAKTVREREANLQLGFWRRLQLRDTHGAREQLEQLLALFPLDGSDTDPMSSHGDQAKHFEYYWLGQRLGPPTRERSATDHAPIPVAEDPGSSEWSVLMARMLEVYALALRTRFLDPTLNGQVAIAIAELNGPGTMPTAHPDRPAISRLATILHECMKNQPSYSEMDWKMIEQSAIELRNFAILGSLADRLIDWARTERTAMGRMGDGKDSLEHNRHDEAFAAFAKIDANSVYSKPAADRMLEIKNTITDRTLVGANTQMRSGDYQGALDEINRVLNLFAGRYPDAIVALSPLAKECERNLAGK